MKEEIKIPDDVEDMFKRIVPKELQEAFRLAEKVEKAKKREYMREYFQQPEVKVKKREYKREYNQKPEVKVKKREYMREYNQKPEVKVKTREYKREYNQKPEVKVKKREYDKLRYKLKKTVGDFEK